MTLIRPVVVQPVTAPSASATRDRLGDYGWPRALALLATAEAVLLLLFHRDLADMAGIWWNSSTFQHCLFIAPITAWLVWQRRGGLARIAPRGWWPGLLLVGVGAVGWLLGDAAGVALARHLGLVLMVQGMVVATLGLPVARALAFPLFYLLFLVPAGEELVPPLQTLTAKMCMALLALAGMPATLDGVFITTPHGWFEVAEACSGVKFLVAMLAFGALAANLCFTRLSRRIAFLAACIVVPVLANGVRAWATIWVASKRGLKLADDFDHIVYGWIFFGLVIAALLAIFWRWFDRSPTDPWFSPERLDPSPRHHRLGWPQALAGLALAAAPLIWSHVVAAAAPPLDRRLFLPAVPGWTRVPMEDAVPWGPSFRNPDHSLIGRYRNAGGHEVDLAVTVFARQEEGRELVGFGQGATGEDGVWTWTSATTPPPGGRAERITAGSPRGPIVREVALFYRVGDVTTGNEARVKLETLRARLLGGPQRAAAILVSAPEPGARAAIDAFLPALGSPERVVAAMLDER
ncbi:exosortase A [Sphingomonas jatrophae]|uniref:Exosortase A n=1 Tax=Sphingomonas jatrophae TaxID=1166337 RepID=A0A1I6JWK8_9SPHN|nr:exosortase A [Sphingomonas jatrophae]SFR83375.1 exosortase A [Sphingomonas jatrophae]